MPRTEPEDEDPQAARKDARQKGHTQHGASVGTREREERITGSVGVKDKKGARVEHGSTDASQEKGGRGRSGG